VQGLECICLLLAYKIKYPENFFMLRGNHECSSINRIYGFYDECKRRYSLKVGSRTHSCPRARPACAGVAARADMRGVFSYGRRSTWSSTVCQSLRSSSTRSFA